MRRNDFFFNDTTTTEIYTLSLHDALPIYRHAGDGALRDPADGGRAGRPRGAARGERAAVRGRDRGRALRDDRERDRPSARSEEHTSELQSRQYLVCRLLLDKKKSHLASRP